MKKNQPVELTKTEFELLYYLLQQEGRVISRDQLMKILRPLKDDPSSRAIDVYILRLRKKLGTGPRHQEYITTIRGVGYKISWPVITLKEAGMQIY
jgi:two-component system alkaline phosphatase synthesis response regulator PhoP